MPTRLKNLCEAAKELYGQQYDRVVAGSSAGHENVACTNAGEVVSDGEEILVEKVSTHLRNRMESAKVSLESIENGVFPWHVTVSSVDDLGKNNC